MDNSQPNRNASSDAAHPVLVFLAWTMALTSLAAGVFLVVILAVSFLDPLDRNDPTSFAMVALAFLTFGAIGAAACRRHSRPRRTP